MLDIGWICSSEVGFRELIVLLANTPYESVFSTDLVITLVKIFKERYKDAIMWRCFIPYMVYFLSTVCFYTIFTSSGIHSEDAKVIARIMGGVIIALDLYFLFFEFVAIMRDDGYLKKDAFNYVDFLTSALNLYLVYETLTETETYDIPNRKTVTILTALAAILMWSKLFYWMTLFSSYSKYVRLIKATVQDIQRFFTIFIVLLMAFGNALMILNEGRYQDN